MPTSARHFLSLINSLPCIAWAVDTDLRYTMVEGGGLAPVGLKPGELAGSTLPEIFGTADPENVVIRHHTRALAGEEQSYDFCFHRRWFRAFLSPERDEQGTIHCVNGLAFDITGQKQAEEALQESEQMLRTIIDASHDCISVRDITSNRYTIYSPSIASLTGFSGEEMNKFGFEWAVGRLHPADRETYLSHAGEVIAGKTVPAQIEYRWKVKNGQYRWFSDSQSLICDDRGNPHALLRISRDITRQKLAELEIRTLMESIAEQQERLSSLVRSIADEVWFADANGKFTLMNPSALREFALTESAEPAVTELAQSLEVFRPDMTPRPVEESPPLLALRGQVVKGYEEIIRTPATGELRYRSVSASPVRDAMGTLIGSVSVVRDITESKRAEEALVRANRQLSLLGSITRHDVRNQLMALMSYIELARIAVPGMDKASEFLQNAYNAALDIDSHIQFMKEYQDVGSRKPQWFSLSELANQIKIPDGILFSAMVEGIEVYADPLLGKVFYNLFDNSLRHGKRVTAIKVSTQNDNGTLRLIWVDNGIGVPEEEKEKIFIRGFGKNTGLGLFLSREILGLTGLLIRENGLADEGARFEILAPPGSWRIAPATDTTPTVNKTEFNPVPGPCEPERAGLL